MSELSAQNEASIVFDKEYVNQLCDHVQQVEDHFAQYFTRSLGRWLRGRVSSRDMMEDIQQETLLRVLVAIRSSETKVRNPERLLQYVIGVCNKVCQEFLRAQKRHSISSDECLEVAGPELSPEELVMLAESKHKINGALTGLAEKDRRALAMVFLDEHPRVDVCKQLGYTKSNFRVVLHRAKSRLRNEYGGMPKMKAGERRAA